MFSAKNIFMKNNFSKNILLTKIILRRNEQSINGKVDRGLTFRLETKLGSRIYQIENWDFKIKMT
jgi:hypothetical protein